jgi:hypothetical protein
MNKCQTSLALNPKSFIVLTMTSGVTLLVESYLNVPLLAAKSTLASKTPSISDNSLSTLKNNHKYYR